MENFRQIEPTSVGKSQFLNFATGSARTPLLLWCRRANRDRAEFDLQRPAFDDGFSAAFAHCIVGNRLAGHVRRRSLVELI
jgi:hypothetical protein